MSDWVVIDAHSSSMVCLRCDARQKLELPMTVKAFLAAADRFTKQHSRCRPRPVPTVIRDENGEPVAMGFKS